MTVMIRRLTLFYYQFITDDFFGNNLCSWHSFCFVVFHMEPHETPTSFLLLNEVVYRWIWGEEWVCKVGIWSCYFLRLTVRQVGLLLGSRFSSGEEVLNLVWIWTCDPAKVGRELCTVPEVITTNFTGKNSLLTVNRQVSSIYLRSESWVTFFLLWGKEAI